jgi:hypothetical protein
VKISNIFRPFFSKVDLSSFIFAMVSSSFPNFNVGSLKAREEEDSKRSGFHLLRVNISRLGAIHHCTNRMNRELKDAYFELVKGDVAGENVHTKIDSQLLTLRKKIWS